MELFYSPGACSLSPHIVLREAGVDFELKKVDLRTKKLESGESFADITPKAYVPTLRLDNGEVITEGAAMVQWVADRNPQAQLAPPNGTIERVRLQEHLNFISSEIHKSFPPLFYPNIDDATKTAAREKITQRLRIFETVLSDGRDYILGASFTVVDAYLFVMLLWSRMKSVDLSTLPNITSFMNRVSAREKVREALRAEGLPVH